jgi:hypothetical protein
MRKAKSLPVAKAKIEENQEHIGRDIVSRDAGGRIAFLNGAQHIHGQKRLSSGVDLRLIARNMACYSD